ncbi:hypothetical protein LINGRAHAP2_LOCUS29803, partial [Linum grandiflorum]
LRISPKNYKHITLYGVTYQSQKLQTHNRLHWFQIVSLMTVTCSNVTGPIKYVTGQRFD